MPLKKRGDVHTEHLNSMIIDYPRGRRRRTIMPIFSLLPAHNAVAMSRPRWLPITPERRLSTDKPIALNAHKQKVVRFFCRNEDAECTHACLQKMRRDSRTCFTALSSPPSTRLPLQPGRKTCRPCPRLPSQASPSQRPACSTRRRPSWSP